MSHALTVSVKFAIFMVLSLGFAVSANADATTQPATPTSSVQQWDIFELALPGPSDGNPFVDVTFSAQFTSGKQTINAYGFYDGNGIYRIRFMPPSLGEWNYQTQSNRDQLNGKSGSFTCTAPSPESHGPVRVVNTYHFAYADGTPFWEIGTTCYGWSQQPDDLVSKTLATLKNSPFNKVRMILCPKKPIAGVDESLQYPYIKSGNGKFDFTQFNPAFFQRQEKHIGQLRDLGIEADVILFSPYDSSHFGFKSMSPENDARFLRYVIARFGAYRNVWWSMSNEFDHIHSKTDADWDKLFQIVQAEDPYGHLRAIHNGARYYDSNKPWVTHMSIQNGAAVTDFGRATLYRDLCRKPIMYDEICYEGNIDRRWGQLSPEEMVFRFWQATIAGAYATHGETYSGTETSWTSQGGTLVGHSAPRLGFLKTILETAPREGIEPIDQYYETHMGGKAGEYYLLYFGKEKPTEWPFELFRDGLKDGMTFHVDLIDTWNMSIMPVDEIFKVVKEKNGYYFKTDGDKKVSLPGQPYMALRIIGTNAVSSRPTTRSDAAGPLD